MSGTVSQIKRMVRLAFFGAIMATIVACSSVYRNHGYAPTEEDLAAITVGVDTRDTVAETIGAPSSSGVLTDSGYYYVASRFRYYGPREPQVVDRQLVAISFDTAGVVRNIERYGLQDGKAVALQRRVTDSNVADKSFLRQLLGNLGRFNPSAVLE